jgi:hypothetical protein
VPLDLSRDCTFIGPALPAPFVHGDLEKELERLKLLLKTTGAEGPALKEEWESYRRRLRELAVRGGPLRVRNCVIEPLVERLGYAKLESADEVETREGKEGGGALLLSEDCGARLRVWTTELNEDLDAPARRGAAYRYSHLRIAQRVLLATGERLGLLTNGVELRLIISDPARLDSQVQITIDPAWKRSRDVPDSYRLLLALASPAAAHKLPDIIDKARLQQTRVTKELRVQARQAIEGFVQGVLDQPENRKTLAEYADQAQLARQLWREALIVVYRLLFVLKLEASDDPAKSFSFASTSLWRNTFSPSTYLVRHVGSVLAGAETGTFLCDERTLVAERKAENAKTASERESLLNEAAGLRVQLSSSRERSAHPGAARPQRRADEVSAQPHPRGTGDRLRAEEGGGPLPASGGGAPLWRDQVGDIWREPKPPFTWPVLASDDERWEVRAAIDAVVADAYGLTREQYAHVLSTFSHASYRRALELCLAKFDELKQIGLDAARRC